MNTKLKILFIFLGWLMLSGYSGVGIQAAGCALQAAVEVLPPALELVDKGIKTGLDELGKMSNKSESPENTVGKDTSNFNHSLKNTESDFLRWDNKSICKQAIKSEIPKWKRDTNQFVAEASRRGLSQRQCVELSGRFPELEVSTASTTDITKDIKSNLLTTCPGTYKSTWNNCSGTRTYSDKAVYKGPWKSGKQHGKGTLTYSDGEKYEGGFKNGLHHGEGTITYPNGKVMKGIWENDKIKSERK